MQVKVKTRTDVERVMRIIRRRERNPLAAQAYDVMQAARALIQRRGRDGDASSPGEPPKTKRGLLPRAIRYGFLGGVAIIGPRFSVAGKSGKPHEHGGQYRGTSYPRRPFMSTANKATAPGFLGKLRDKL